MLCVAVGAFELRPTKPHKKMDLMCVQMHASVEARWGLKNYMQKH